MQKVLYPSVIESGNLGDILINSLIVRELCKSKVVLLKGKPPIEMLNLIYLNNTNSKNIEILNCDNRYYILRKLNVLFTLFRYRQIKYVFDTPGHISSKRSIIKTLLKEAFEIFKILFYRIFGVKALKFGITLGPFTKIEWNVYKLISKICFMIGVRDQDNFNYLKKRHFKNIKLVPDLAFLLYNNSILISSEKINKNNSITISLRGNIKGKELDEDYISRTIIKTIELLRNLLQYDQNIKTINIAYQVDCDRVLIPKLKKEFNENFVNIEIRIFEEILNFETAKILYLTSNYVITNRLHVFLFAMNLGTLSFIVTDVNRHTKLISIIIDLNLNSLIFNSHQKFSFLTGNEIENYQKIASRYKYELITAISEL